MKTTTNLVAAVIAAAMLAPAASAQHPAEGLRRQSMEALCELYETITLRAARAYHASRPLSEVRKELRAVAAAKVPEIVAPLKGVMPDEGIGDLKAGLVQGADEAAVEAYEILAARELFPIRSADPARFAAENYAACLKSIDGKDEDEKQ